MAMKFIPRKPLKTILIYQLGNLSMSPLGKSLKTVLTLSTAVSSGSLKTLLVLLLNTLASTTLIQFLIQQLQPKPLDHTQPQSEYLLPPQAKTLYLSGAKPFLKEKILSRLVPDLKFILQTLLLQTPTVFFLSEALTLQAASGEELSMSQTALTPTTRRLSDRLKLLLTQLQKPLFPMFSEQALKNKTELSQPAISAEPVKLQFPARSVQSKIPSKTFITTELFLLMPSPKLKIWLRTA